MFLAFIQGYWLGIYRVITIFIIFFMICIVLYLILRLIDKRLQKTQWLKNELEKRSDLILTLKEFVQNNDVTKINKILKENRFTMVNSVDNENYVLKTCAQFNLIEHLKHYTSSVFMTAPSQEGIDEACRIAVIYNNFDALAELLQVNRKSFPKPDTKALFQFCASLGYANAIEFLQKKTNLTPVKQDDIDHAFIIAVQNNHKNVLSVLLSGSEFLPSKEKIEQAYFYAEQHNLEDMKKIIKIINEDNEGFFL
jgi:hypothetical protein